jgi:hypothetical protein
MKVAILSESEIDEVVDSDTTTIHRPDHDPHAAPDPDCRKGEILRKIEAAKRHLAERPGRPEPPKLAVGLCVPAIEAWYLCGVDPQVTEANWSRMLGQGKASHARAEKLRMKAAVFGPHRISRERQIEIAVGHARRLAPDLHRLRQDFPHGFGLFAQEIEAWRQAASPPGP